MAKAPSADDLVSRITLLRISMSGTDYVWSKLGTAWAGAEYSGGRNIYSTAGIGGENIKLIMRDIPSLTLADAAEWGGRHFFFTRIDRISHPGWLYIDAAAVTLVTCTANADEDNASQFSFPAVLTEKYIKHDRPEPMSTNIISFVLITPKAISLKAGGLVDVDGTPYEVQVCHTTEEYKNEFEVVRTCDL